MANHILDLRHYTNKKISEAIGTFSLRNIEKIDSEFIPSAIIKVPITEGLRIVFRVGSLEIKLHPSFPLND